MNECEQAGRLNAYHDGEMSPPESAQLERHLRQCPRCAAELDRMQKLTTLLSALPAAQMPDAAMDRLHQAVRRLPVARPGILRLAEELAALAAMILLACVLGLSQQGLTPQPAGPMPVREPAAAARDGAVPAGDAAALSWDIEAMTPPGESVSEGSEEPLVSWMAQDPAGSGKDEHE